MALIRQSRTGAITRDAVVLDLGDLSRQGEQLKARARAEADGIIAEARAERERLMSTASEEGRAAGLAKGTEEGRAKGTDDGRKAALIEIRERAAKLEAGWTVALKTFEAERDRMLLEARQDVLRLACAVAEMVTKRVVSLDPSRVADQLDAVLAMLARPTRLTISVHPEDQPLAKEMLPGICEKYAAATHVEITPDPALTRGSCVARTSSGGVIDASITTQLERIVATLLPDATTAPPAPEPGAAP